MFGPMLHVMHSFAAMLWYGLWMCVMWLPSLYSVIDVNERLCSIYIYTYTPETYVGNKHNVGLASDVFLCKRDAKETPNLLGVQYLPCTLSMPSLSVGDLCGLSLFLLGKGESLQKYWGHIYQKKKYLILVILWLIKYVSFGVTEICCHGCHGCFWRRFQHRKHLNRFCWTERPRLRERTT